MENWNVWIEKIAKAEYPKAPFHPGKVYPEFADLCYAMEAGGENEIYEAVRQVLYHLGYDEEHFGTECWNPFENLVKSGDRVVIKPNFVRGTHIWGEQGVRAMITHMALVRPLIDYVLLAADGEADIIIGDAPIRTSEWDAIVEHSGVRAMLQYYEEKGVHISLIDFRKNLALSNQDKVYEKTIPNPQRCEQDYIEVDIEGESMLCEIMAGNDHFEMGGVKSGTVKKYHNMESNTYLIPREILEADVFINVPKMKTHRMAGLTCAMKNVIGVNGEKERIAHYRRGVKSKNSDEFEKFSLVVFLRERIWMKLKYIEKPWSRKLMTWGKRIVQKYVWKGKTFEETYALNPPKLYREGGWEGNDTLWRCAVDINRILLYADRNGKLQDEKQRKYFCIVDGVIAGEGEGPLANTPKEVGVVFGGENPVMVDYAAASIMNFDYKLMPMICRSMEKHKYPLFDDNVKEIKVGSNVTENEYTQDFVPTSGWKVLFCSKGVN